VTLRLKKQGFYPTEMTFSERYKEPTQGVKIVMDEIGVLAEMKRFGIEFISMKADGSGNIVEFGSKMTLRKVEQVETDSPLADHYMYLTAERENGSFKLVEKVINKYNKIKRMPPVVRLMMGNQNDGFILYDHTHANPRIAFPYRRMKEAPEEGYKKEISIPLRDDDYYFYFKVGGRYGKGLIKSLSDYTSQEIQAGVELYLQTKPDGSRNVNIHN
jgi:hypothetical protein